MQNFWSLWLNAGAQITHGGQVQRPRQKSIVLLIADVLQVAYDVGLCGQSARWPMHLPKPRLIQRKICLST